MNFLINYFVLSYAIDNTHSLSIHFTIFVGISTCESSTSTERDRRPPIPSCNPADLNFFKSSRKRTHAFEPKGCEKVHSNTIFASIFENTKRLLLNKVTEIHAIHSNRQGESEKTEFRNAIYEYLHFIKCSSLEKPTISEALIAHRNSILALEALAKRNKMDRKQQWMRKRAEKVLILQLHLFLMF